jgi:hypothetical protein
MIFCSEVAFISRARDEVRRGGGVDPEGEARSDRKDYITSLYRGILRSSGGHRSPRRSIKVINKQTSSLTTYIEAGH